MKKRRFYIDNLKDLSPDAGTLLDLPQGESHHLRNVLRIRKGTVIALFDGKGMEADAVVDSFSPDGVMVRLMRIISSSERYPHYSDASAAPRGNVPVKGESFESLNVNMALPFLKADKLETVFRMASQLGAAGFCVFPSLRCIPHPGNAGMMGKMKRWEKIILDSIRISRRSLVPRLQCFDSLENLLKTFSQDRKIFFAYEMPGLPLLSHVLSGIMTSLSPEISRSTPLDMKDYPGQSIPFRGFLLVTGPEGGFLQEEADLAAHYGAALCSLGEGILKAETAPVAALSIILSFLGRI
ncbi:16S rRNA (uracil(1498)-N(3))-methyltransferase [Candidatus Sumerlaeota bacterium]|nr:16S rRNA (uracil(1498)-N(3))-methyltransferase [Candidatus Sumerlaeota bacterium]